MTSIVRVLAVIGGVALGPPPARADVVVDWNAVTVSALGAQNPFAQARIAAVAHLAVFEAVNAITAEFAPYTTSIDAPAGASADAAAVAAGHAVLVHYLPAAAAALDAARAAALAGIPDSPSKDAGIAVGEAAAAALIALRAHDGSAPPQFYLPASSNPGEWQPTPACPPAGGVFLHWRHVTPFGVRSSSQFRSAPPPPLVSGRYAADYEEVRTVGAADSVGRPPDRADVALFYNANLAVPVWNDVARQLAAVSPQSLTAHARAFALLNMAISDALVTVMETKYHYTFWRPETAIRAGDADGNRATAPNIDFAPFITSPCFPGYPSAHASASYAGRAILQSVWAGGPPVIVLTHPALPHVVLQYTSLAQITDDIDDARVYGGIHFRFDQVAGARQGIGIGRYIATRYLRPSHGFAGAR